MKLLCYLVTLAASAIAAPTSTADPSHRFRLHSRALDPSNPSFNNLYFQPYHIYPSFNYAVLTPQTTSSQGIIGHLNGTAAERESNEGNLIYDYSAGSPPYGFVIDQVNATYNPVEIDAGNGTRGIFIDQGVVKYHNPLSGGFYGE